MKKRIGIVIVVVAIILVACLLSWRFIPQAFLPVLSMDPDTVTGVSAVVVVNRVVDGQFDLADFSLDADSGSAGEIIDILCTSAYRRDFRSLLPWGADSVDGGKDYDGQTVTVLFYNGTDTASVQFLGSGTMTVSNSQDGKLRIYHPTNPAAVAQLTGYIQSNSME